MMMIKEPWQKTAGLGSSIDFNDIERDLNIIENDIKNIANDIISNNTDSKDIIWDKWEIEDQDATLTPEQINRMSAQKLNWNNNNLLLMRLVFIHGFSEKCEKIDIILNQIYQNFNIEKKDPNKDCCNFAGTLDDTELKVRRTTLITTLQKIKDLIKHLIKLHLKI